MKMTEPQVDQRDAQPTVGIRTLATMAELPTVIPQLHREVFTWLREQGITPAGPPFTHYHVIDMANQLDIELGVPVASDVSGNDRIAAGALPAGRYAALTYTGIENGVAANWELLKWGAAQGLTWDQWDTPNGDAFGSRYESDLTDPADEPDMTKWETEVAIRLADE